MSLDPHSSPAVADDTMLVAALRAGDYDAFESIYRSEFTSLHRYAASLVSHDDAIDVVQDVFFTIWNNRRELPVNTAQELRYYLFRAVRNRAYKVNRHYSVRDRYDPHIAADRDSPLHPSLHSVDTLSDDFTDDLASRVQQVVLTLPPRSREVLTLRWYHNLPFDQIARIMEISYAYAHVLHSRALAMVRTRLGLP